MSSQGVGAVIFEGSSSTGPLSEMMTRVRQAALLDNLDKMKQVQELSKVYLFTNDEQLADRAAAVGAVVEINSIHPEKFHFGRELKKFLARRPLQKIFYLGGGGCPLITVDEISSICRMLLERDRFLYTNNTQSSDMVAFTLTGNLATADLPAADNSLAWALRDFLGLEMELMPRSPGLLYDLDTPADILVLGAGPYAGERTRQALDSLQLDYSRLERAKRVLTGAYEDVVLMGRVGAPVIERLNSALKLRLRVFSEERGMKALGRVESGEAVSMMGFLLEDAGIDKFFDCLTRVANCAFIDTRVLMAHYRCNLGEEERFLSDLGRWQEISHPWLQQFTRSAVQCSIPVILGGHSLVSGSLWALSWELAR